MAASDPALQELLPLTPAVFHVLLALSSGPRHGYAIMKDVEALTEGQMVMGPGTLYGTIKRMLPADLIEETEAPAGEDLDDRPRRFYQLTGHGRHLLAAEAIRLERLVRAARARHILRGAG